MSTSDLTLLKQWRQRRDAEAFKTVAARHAGMVFGACRRILGNTADAEEVAQECFERLATTSNLPTGNLAAWLHVAATHRALDRVRSERRRREREARYTAEQAAVTEPEWDDVYQYVDEAIAQLPEKLRVPLVAHFLEDQSQRAIAQSCGMPRRTVTNRIAKGVELVRKALRRKGIAVSVTSLAAMMNANMAEAAPAPLTATLGRLAVSGLRNAVPEATAASGGMAVAKALGGLVVMKKGTVAIGVLVALLLGGLFAVRMPGDESEDSVASPATTAESVVGAQTGEPPAEQPDASGADHVAVARGTEIAHVANTESSGGDPARAPEGGTISGRVHDAATGKGIEGAVIDAYSQHASSGWAKSDAVGRYAITGLPEGTYEIRPTLVPGYPEVYAVQRLTVTVATGQRLERVDFARDKGISVAGQVLDIDGEPAAGVRVAGITNGMPGSEHAESMKDGTFEIRFLRPGPDLLLQARTDDFESEMLGPYTLTAKGLDGLVLTLSKPRKSSLAGHVVDPSGRIVAGASIHLDRGASDYLVGSGRGKSGKDGSFEIAELAAGKYGIILSPPGASGYSSDDTATRVELREGQALTGLRLVLGGNKGGLAIAGIVTNTAGNPIPNVRVSAWGANRENATTGDDGTFRMAGLLEGEYRLSTHHMRKNSDDPRYSATRTHKAWAGANDVVIVLHGEASVEGRVVRADTGEPLTEFEVFLVNGAASQFTERLLLNVQRTQHPEGQFSRTSNVGPHTITAKAPGFAPAFQAVDLVENETVSDLVLRLEPSSTIHGTVVDTAGHPVPDAGIYFGGVPHETALAQSVAQSDAKGAFAIDSVSPDVRMVSAYHPDFAPATVAVSDEMVLVLAAPGRIAGRITRGGDSLEDPVSVGVQYLDRTTMPGHTGSRTDDEGNYSIASLPAGHVEVRVDSGRNAPFLAEAFVEAGQTTTVDIDLPLGSSVVEGRITAAGMPPGSFAAAVTVFTAHGKQRLFPAVRPDGSYRQENVPAGRGEFTAYFSTTDHLSLTRNVDFEVGDNQVARVDVDFAGGTTVAGRILGFAPASTGGVFLLAGNVNIPEEANPEFLAHLMTETGELRPVATAVCAADGSFEVPGVEPGTYTVLTATSPAEAGEDLSKVRLASTVVRVEGTEPVVVDFDFR